MGNGGPGGLWERRATGQVGSWLLRIYDSPLGRADWRISSTETLRLMKVGKKHSKIGESPDWLLSGEFEHGSETLPRIKQIHGYPANPNAESVCVNWSEVTQ